MKIYYNKKTNNILLYHFLINLGVLLVSQIGTFLPVPGTYLNITSLKGFNNLNNNLLGNLYNNQGFILNLFYLNIFPYLKANLLLQFFITIFPKLKTENFSNYKTGYFLKILTLVFSAFQSIHLGLYLKPQLLKWNYFLAFNTSLWLISGSMIILWLSELINEYGLGNGISFFLYLKVLFTIIDFIYKFIVGNYFKTNILFLISFCFFSFISLYGTLFLAQGIKKIPLIQTKFSNKKLASNKLNYNYIPISFNQVGIVPVLLTVIILETFNTLVGLNFRGGFSQFIYWLNYFLLISYITFLYSLTALDPTNLANQLQKKIIGIISIRPGLQTKFYLKQTVERITLIGSIILAILTATLALIESIFTNITKNSLNITTCLLISTTIFLDLIYEIENIFFFSAYK